MQTGGQVECNSPHVELGSTAWCHVASTRGLPTALLPQRQLTLTALIVLYSKDSTLFMNGMNLPAKNPETIGVVDESDRYQNSETNQHENLAA